MELPLVKEIADRQERDVKRRAESGRAPTTNPNACMTIPEMESLMLGQTEARTLRHGAELIEQGVVKLAPSTADHLKFLFLVVILGALNVYSIVDRFVTRPERDPEVHYNFSILALAWTEMGVLVVLGMLVIVNGVASVDVVFAMRNGRCHAQCAMRKGRCFCYRELRGRNYGALKNFCHIVSILAQFSLFSVLPMIKSAGPDFYAFAKRLKRDRDHGVCMNSQNCLDITFCVLTIPVIASAPLAVLVKISQVSFADKPPLEWTYEEVLQFAAFINNLIGIDRSQKNLIYFMNMLLFAGKDSHLDSKEAAASFMFQKLTIATLVDEIGLYNTIVTCTTLDAAKCQTMLIKERATGNKEGSRDYH
eukprot:COSAG01_NODE_1095_length_11714_cov_9.062930_10_plen_364_part_00